MRIGIHIPLIHILKDNTHTLKDPHIHTDTYIHIHTHIYAIANSNVEKPKRITFFILSKNEFNLLDIHNAIVLCYEMLFLSVFTLMIFIDKKIDP